MTEQRSVPKGTEIASNTNILLAGFPISESDGRTKVFESIGWTVLALTKLDEIEQAFAINRFDVTVIDAEHIEFYAPHVVAELRCNKGRPANATILAVSQTILEGFAMQLVASGVDLVVPRPSDPKLYIPYITRAATMRLQTKGGKHV